jgi:hypothetical protein
LSTHNRRNPQSSRPRHDGQQGRAVDCPCVPGLFREPLPFISRGQAIHSGLPRAPSLSFRVGMGLRPTHQRNENHICRRPRKCGGPSLVRNTMDSRFRGNDVIFEKAARGICPWPFFATSAPLASLREAGALECPIELCYDGKLLRDRQGAPNAGPRLSRSSR